MLPKLGAPCHMTASTERDFMSARAREFDLSGGANAARAARLAFLQPLRAPSLAPDQSIHQIEDTADPFLFLVCHSVNLSAFKKPPPTEGRGLEGCCYCVALFSALIRVWASRNIIVAT